MKSKCEKTRKKIEADYKKIMKQSYIDKTPVVVPQWVNPGDYIVKFTLYQETPNSITSTETLVDLGNY